jgi:hypothetical protein
MHKVKDASKWYKWCLLLCWKEAWETLRDLLGPGYNCTLLVRDYPYQGHRVPVVHVRTRKMSREQLSYTRGVCYCVENGKMFGVRTGWLILICFWFYNLFLKNTKIGSSPSRCVMCVVLGWNVIFKDVFSLKYNNLIFF